MDLETDAAESSLSRATEFVTAGRFSEVGELKFCKRREAALPAPLA